MRGSLANLPRMSMDALNQRDDGDRTLRIWLLSAVTAHGGATSYRLAGRFQANGQTWEVLRRYSEFLALRGKLIKFLADADDNGIACPGCVNYLHAIQRFEFPKKHLFSSRNPAVVNYRVKALRSFMNLLASWAFSTAPKCPLCGGHAFDLVRNFVVDGAEPVTGSDMDYIRGSISVDAFTSNAERPSAFARPSLERRHSWIPASGSATLRAHQEQQQQQQQQQQQFRPSASAGVQRPQRPQNTGPKEPDAYDTFNDYLPARPSQRAKGSNTETATSNLKFSVQRPGDKQQEMAKPQYQYQQQHKPESFLLYSDASFGRATADGEAASVPINGSSNTNFSSTGSRDGKLRKHRSEPRNITAPNQALYHHNADDSFASFSSTVDARTANGSIAFVGSGIGSGGSGIGSGGSGSGSGSGSDSSQHSNMLTSPNVQPTPQQSSASFASGAGGRQFSGVSPSDEELKISEEEEEDDDNDVVDDDDIDVTGLALASPPRKTRPTSQSGEGLWEPWELSRAG